VFAGIDEGNAARVGGRIKLPGPGQASAAGGGALLGPATDLERPELPLRDCAVPSSNSSVTPRMVVSDPEGAVSFLHDVFDGVGEVEGGLR